MGSPVPAKSTGKHQYREPLRVEHVSAMNGRDARTHFVYQVLDEFGRVLYVGESRDVFARMGQHKSTSEWYSKMKRLIVEEYATRQDAIHREADLIERAQPPFNVVGVKTRQYPRHNGFAEDKNRVFIGAKSPNHLARMMIQADKERGWHFD